MIPIGPRKDVKHYLSCLSDFPRVKSNIETMWGTEQGRKYIYGLIIDNRTRDNNKVQGFPNSVISAINSLLELHDEFYPKCQPPTNIWDVTRL